MYVGVGLFSIDRQRLFPSDLVFWRRLVGPVKSGRRISADRGPRSPEFYQSRRRGARASERPRPCLGVPCIGSPAQLDRVLSDQFRQRCSNITDRMLVGRHPQQGLKEFC